jgi:hypothetical protein
MNNAKLFNLTKLSNKAYELIFQRLHVKLEPANFSLADMNSKWGTWNPEKRLITLSIKLINNYPENAIKFVLFHEIAHQVVSEVFKFHCDGISHGEHFQKACDVLEIPMKTCCSHDFLNEFEHGENSPILSKIQKLMDTTGRTEEETIAFMRKAQEIMMKHNLSLQDVIGKSKLYIKRAVGESYARFPTYIFSIAVLISKFYGVQYIRSYHYTTFGVDARSSTNYHIEFFGEPEKLDIAEYMYHAILNNGDYLYEEFKNNPEREIGCRKISKASFMEGLVAGFTAKMSKMKVEAEAEIIKTHGYNGILKLNDPMLREAYESCYNNRKNVARVSSRGDGRSAGFNAGQNLSIHSGVKSNSMKLIA